MVWPVPYLPLAWWCSLPTASIFLACLRVWVSSMMKNRCRFFFVNKLRSISKAICCITTESFQMLRQRNSPWLVLWVRLWCPRGRAPKCFGQAVNSCSVTDCDGYYQGPKMVPRPLIKMLVDRFEKTLQFFGNSADCNHMVSPMISVCYYKSYRQDRPFFFCVLRNYKFNNRSVWVL